MLIASLILGVIVVLVCSAVVRVKLDEHKVRQVLRHIYGPPPSTPRLVTSSTYGYPNFTILFHTEANVLDAEASGKNAKFRQYIANKYRGHGPRERPFDVRQSVGFHVEGYDPLEDFKKRAAQREGKQRSP